jgi:hypothetical protein
MVGVGVLLAVAEGSAVGVALGGVVLLGSGAAVTVCISVATLRLSTGVDGEQAVLSKINKVGNRVYLAYLRYW